MTASPSIVTNAEWARFAAPRVEPSQWNTVIAAAGRGSRLGFDKPKILFPVGGRTILEWLLDLLLPRCAACVFVLSPEGRKEVEPHLESHAKGRYHITVQETPTGMGDAIAIGMEAVDTPFAALLWGDQVAIRPESIEAVLRLHQGPLVPSITVPTVMRPDPYIHFERDTSGRITRVLQAREGDAMPGRGESDAGFFCFCAEPLRGLLEDIRSGPNARGARTGEFNLLPVIPYAASLGLRVLTPQIMEIEETVGINSAADAARVEPYLRRIYA